MPVAQQEVTPQEAIEVANRVGLNSVKWNGSMLTLVLLDGNEIIMETYMKEGYNSPPSFLYRTTRVQTPTEQY